ncbi:MAG: TetR/AcrR family transcriptional regulator [Brucellaceae bacterium]|nr:TetR/AcrR family transcriptional regulator [Brucellaceae bacterium]
MKQGASLIPEPPRQKRSLRTRAALLSAVEGLVAAEGADAVTTTRIAAETGVAVGTIYRYFADREALLLAAYDETVGRVVAECNKALATLPEETLAPDAARSLLRCYLEAAEAIPAHAGLLRAMRAIRPVAADYAANESEIERDILAPFFKRFLPEADAPPVALVLINAMIGTLVDLYLVTEEQAERDWLRSEIEAQLAFMVERLD